MADEPQTATPEAEADAPASLIEEPEKKDEAPVETTEESSEEASNTDLTSVQIEDSQIEVRDASKREIDIRIVPWDTPVNPLFGFEEFRKGAFEGTDPGKVMLMQPGHMAHMAIGHDGQPKLSRRPAGKGIRLEERPDAAYMTFKVANTAAGDEILALASDGIESGASIEFRELPSGSVVETRNGRRTKVHKRVNLRAVSTTYEPAYAQAQVLAVRSQEGVAPVAEEQAPATGATETTTATPAVVNYNYDFTPLERAVSSMTESMGSMSDRLGRFEEQTRAQFSIPEGTPQKRIPGRGEWLRTVLGMLSGERISQHDLQTRELAELITTDNIGVVPDAYSSELIGVIDPRRPFMQTTRKLNTPASGMSLVMPKIVTRPTVAQQVAEKDQLASTTTSVTTVTFDAVSKGGAGDISLQLLKRSDPSFLGLYLELLAEAYAQESEQEAVEALLAGGVASGGAMDPEGLVLATAWQGTFDAIRRPPDTIWLSSAAVGAFLDAKSDGTNAPLYSTITSNFTAGGGVGGSISGLRAVHVPALDSTDSDVIIGPSTGFAWAEDGTYTLQVDVPAKAGRDVAIIGMLWFAPLYPAAFTVYSVAGGGS